jgi:hypothetical protein
MSPGVTKGGVAVNGTVVLVSSARKPRKRNGVFGLFFLLYQARKLQVGKFQERTARISGGHLFCEGNIGDTSI